MMKTKTKIEVLRDRLGYTQEEFSIIMGLTKRQIINLEQKKSKVTDKTAILCELLDRFDAKCSNDLEQMVKISKKKWKG